MKARNLPTRVHARRTVALRNLERRPQTDERDAEIQVLRERTDERPQNYLTKKLLAHASGARRLHHLGKMTR